MKGTGKGNNFGKYFFNYFSYYLGILLLRDQFTFSYTFKVYDNNKTKDKRGHCQTL